MSDLSARLRVAAICTIYHEWSHADAIVTKFLKGMSTAEGFFPPEVDVVSMYIDHVLENDVGVDRAAKHGIPVHPSIRRALHAGSDQLGVDAVLLLAEHGAYRPVRFELGTALTFVKEIIRLLIVERKVRGTSNLFRGMRDGLRIARDRSWALMPPLGD